jgi:hypothetical protein
MNRKRTNRSAEQWTALIAEQEASAVSMSQFARERGIPLASLLNRKRKLRENADSGRSPKAKQEFSEVVVVPRVRSVSLRVEVITRSGVAIRLDGSFDSALLREVLRAASSC